MRSAVMSCFIRCSLVRIIRLDVLFFCFLFPGGNTIYSFLHIHLYVSFTYTYLSSFSLENLLTRLYCITTVLLQKLRRIQQNRFAYRSHFLRLLSNSLINSVREAGQRQWGWVIWWAGRCPRYPARRPAPLRRVMARDLVRWEVAVDTLTLSDIRSPTAA